MMPSNGRCLPRGTIGSEREGKLHAEGKSVREIADLTGVSKSMAQRIIANLKPAA